MRSCQKLHSVNTSDHGNTETHDTHDTQIPKTHRDSDTQETHDTQEYHRFERASSLQSAAKLALEDKSKGDPIFKFCRAMRSFEKTTDTRLPEKEWESAFNIWWIAAKDLLPPDTDRDESLALFMDAFPKTMHPLGTHAIERAVHLLGTTSEPEDSARYSSPIMRKLVHLCWCLQAIVGENDFYLSLRSASEVIGVKKLETISAFLGQFERHGILKLKKKGIGRMASEYRYIGKTLTQGHFE